MNDNQKLETNSIKKKIDQPFENKSLNSNKIMLKFQENKMQEVEAIVPNKVIYQKCLNEVFYTIFYFK